MCDRGRKMAVTRRGGIYDDDADARQKNRNTATRMLLVFTCAEQSRARGRAYDGDITRTVEKIPSK